MGTVRVFRHYVHPTFIWLACIEACILMLAFHLVAGAQMQQESFAATHNWPPLFAPLPVTFALLTVVCMAAMGLYQPHMREGYGAIVRRTCGAFAGMIAIMGLCFYLLPDVFQWQDVFLKTALTGLLFLLICRYTFARIVGRETLQRRVLVYGAGRSANTILHSMRRASDRRGFRFVGFVSTGSGEQVIDPKRIIELDRSIAAYAKQNNIDQIVVAVDDRRSGLPIQDLLDCKLSGIQVLDEVSFFEQEAGKIMLEFVTAGWLVFSDGFESGFFTRIGKRVIDFGASFILLMGTWPIMLATIIAIWVEEGFSAPLLYRQERVGLEGKCFQVLKFRSMTVNAEPDGEAQWAKQNDSRVTRVGRFMRRSRIDELPQIINVLAGDMAFIGPRPERPQFVDELCEKVPHYAARHHVKPGITGWAQLCYPYGAGVKDAAQKLQYDLYYVKNHSLFLDCLILISTVEVILFGKGAR